jgi:transcriptional regulator with XRE-family HTH domain
VALREKVGLSQRDLARKLKTSQQQISRLESPSYEGHSLSMLRRVANVLGATVNVTLAPKGESEPMLLSEAKVAYKIRRKA